ncbi:MAG: BTAD domain-containing putative transcriptional regulator [Acidimicrobiia bacterium]|nr:BTAD domain-containing putative transcriptional regulator [Acidimicrobiia bacterium]
MGAGEQEQTRTTPLRVSALGDLRIAIDGQRVDARIPDKAALLLVYLADAGGPVRRGVLAGLLWSDMPDERARANLRVALTRLRAVAGNHIGADRDRVWISTSVDYDASTIDDAASDEQADAVLDRYLGDFLNALTIEGAELFEDWAAARRQNLQATALQALTKASADSLSADDLTRCRDCAQRILEIEPWHEVAHQHLMIAMASISGPAAAHAQYEVCASVLWNELGLTPSPDTTAVLDQIVAGTTQTPAEETTRTVGIPTDLTPFFGRELELSLLGERLKRGDYRLMTIVGPGGVGKTRLAAEAARASVEAHPAGVFFLSLASVASEAEMLSAVFDAIAPDAVQSAAEPRDRVIELIGDKRMCLVLDNFEHLVDDARDTVVALLQGCSGLRLLTTSREPLEVSSEDLFVLCGLETPEPGASDIAESPAVRLFADRAYRVDKTFSLAAEDPDEVGRLCRLLEGIPLHLELTAARIGPLSVGDLNAMLHSEIDLPGEALRDAPDRHRTFDAVFEHSWATLEPDEQRALAHLSVTRDGFDSEAAHALIGSSGHEASRLARKSLLVEEGGRRFRFHELLRQSAAARLDDRVAAETAHARWFLGRVAEAEATLISGEAPTVSDGLVRDLDNVRAAWRYALAHGLTSELGSAAMGVGYLFELAGRVVEAPGLTSDAADAIRERRLDPDGDHDEAFFRRITARLLAVDSQDAVVDELCDRIDELLAEAPARDADRAWANLHRAQSAFYDGDLTRASVMLEATESQLDDLDEPELRAWSLLQRGRLLSATGSFDDAIAVYRQALELFEHANDVRAQALTHSYLAPTYAEQNKVWEAYVADSTAMSLTEKIGNRQRLASLHINVGASLVLLGDYERARRHTATALDLFRSTGDLQVEGYALAQHAECLVGLGRHEEGERDFVEGIALTRSQKFTYGLLYNLPPWVRHLQDRGRHEQAIVAAEELVEIAADREASHFALTGKALIARSAAILGELESAAALADEVMVELAAPDAPALPWPVATHLDLAAAFHAADGSRAVDAIATAQSIQTATARSITDPELRRCYLEDHPASIELAALRSV